MPFTIKTLLITKTKALLRPDMKRLRQFKELPITTNLKELRRCKGFFAYYANWIPNFSSKVNLLTVSPTFAVQAFEDFKMDIVMSVTTAIYKTSIRSGNGCFRSSYDSDIETCWTASCLFLSFGKMGGNNYSAIEKEALTIIKAVRHWSYNVMYRQAKHKVSRIVHTAKCKFCTERIAPASSSKE